jgi:multicomponent Na+:H+ antiporter subunit G
MNYEEFLGLARILMADAAVLLGSIIMLISCIGMVRLPDFFTRSHAIGKGMTLGISLLLIGLWLSTPNVSGLKILVAIFFQFVTIPVASHLLSMLAYRGVEGESVDD